MLSGYRFYELYLAIQLHFKENNSYDFFKYNGSLKVEENTYLAVRGRVFFDRAARYCKNEQKAIDYIVSNFIRGNKWINEFKEKPYLEYCGYRDAYSYKFKEDLKLYKLDKGLKLCYSGNSNPYFYMCLLNIATNGAYFKKLDNTQDFLWENLKQKLLKLSPFIEKYWCINNESKAQLRQIFKETV